MRAGVFETVNNIISLITLAYLALVINGVVKAPTRESRERYEMFRQSESARWVRIGIPVLFVVVLLLFLFDKPL